MDRGACQATVPGVSKSWTHLTMLDRLHVKVVSELYFKGWWILFTHTFTFLVCVCVCVCAWVGGSVMPNSVIPWPVAHCTPLSMEFSRQEYCSRLPFPSPGDLPNPGIKPGSLNCRWCLYLLSYQGIHKYLIFGELMVKYLLVYHCSQ